MLWSLILPCSSNNIVTGPLIPTTLLQVYHESGNMQVVEVTCFEAYSPKRHFLYLTTATQDPAVDTYMIFTVRTNVFVDEITYVVSLCLWISQGLFTSAGVYGCSFTCWLKFVSG